MTALRLVHLECDGPDGEGCPQSNEFDTGCEGIQEARDWARVQSGWDSPMTDVDLCRLCRTKVEATS